LFNVKKEDNILFLDTFESRIVIVAQDTRKRRGIATLKIIILEHKEIEENPVEKGEVILKDYHAPVGISMTKNGILLFPHDQTLGWVDLKRNGYSSHPDGYADAGKKIHSSQIVTDKCGKTLALFWIPSEQKKKL